MKALTSIIAIGILALFFNTHTFAADTEHKLEALAHAEEAVKHGEMGHANELLKYAEDSLEHAKMDHADVATEHAKKAMKHLRQSGVRTTH